MALLGKILWSICTSVWFSCIYSWLFRPDLDPHLVKDKKKKLEDMQKFPVSWHLSKCKVMNVTLKRKKIVSPLYHLSGVHLEEVRKYKYLGVIITHNLTWSEHCSAKVKTANKIIGILFPSMEPIYQERHPSVRKGAKSCSPYMLG